MKSLQKYKIKINHYKVIQNNLCLILFYIEQFIKIIKVKHYKIIWTYLCLILFHTLKSQKNGFPKDWSWLQPSHEKQYKYKWNIIHFDLYLLACKTFINKINKTKYNFM